MRPDHVARYLTLCREAGRGIRANREISLLSSAYAWAMGQSLGVDRNPCYGVRRNRQRPRGRCPSVREVLLFARHYAPRWLRVFLLLKLLTGHRQADVRQLLRSAGTDRGLVMAEGKKRDRRRRYRWTRSLRIVWAAALALERPTSSVCLFTTRSGGQMTASGLKSAWARAMKAWKADGREPFAENDVRATAATAAKTLALAQELLGHNNPAITGDVYRRGEVKVRPLR